MKREELPLLVATSTIIAAKLEQPMTPSIKRMIKLLTLEEQQGIEKESVLYLERQMLTTLSFDFSAPSPLSFIERFLRLGDLQADPIVLFKAKQLLKMATSMIIFLDFRPSLIAASALILAFCIQLQA